MPHTIWAFACWSREMPHTIWAFACWSQEMAHTIWAFACWSRELPQKSKSSQCPNRDSKLPNICQKCYALSQTVLWDMPTFLCVFCDCLVFCRLRPEISEKCRSPLESILLWPFLCRKHKIN